MPQTFAASSSMSPVFLHFRQKNQWPPERPSSVVMLSCSFLQSGQRTSAGRVGDETVIPSKSASRAQEMIALSVFGRPIGRPFMTSLSLEEYNRLILV